MFNIQIDVFQGETFSKTKNTSRRLHSNWMMNLVDRENNEFNGNQLKFGSTKLKKKSYVFF